MIQSPSRKRRAFTLVEVLVVIVIISLLAAIVFPVFSKARERALVTSDAANLRQIGHAVLMYARDHDDAMPFEGKTHLCTPQVETENPVDTQDTLMPYVKNTDIFKSPADTGDGLDPTPFHVRYGRSYKMEGRVLSKRAEKKTTPAWRPFIRHLSALESGVDEKKALENKAQTVFPGPSQLQLAREEFAVWDIVDKNTGLPKVETLKDEMDNALPGNPQWQRKAWFSQGANVVFLDGHVKFIVSKDQWDTLKGDD